MLVWGKSPIKKLDDHSLIGPCQNTVLFKNQSIKKVALGNNSSCLLFNNGSIQTYYDKVQGLDNQRPDVTSLKDSVIVDLFGGSGHTFAIDKDQNVYGWGCNTKGQLGIESEDVITTVPRLVPLSPTKKIVSVACGQSHSIMLTKDSELFAMGDNTYGQLGIEKLPFTTKPICIASLMGVPVGSIATGSWHSFIITASGRVFAWGRNDCGQLGLGNIVNQTNPMPMKTINSSVAFISAGFCHSAILTGKGEVFTFGLGSRGQLGHSSSYKNEDCPKFVEEFRGSVATQIACGFNHTVVFLPDCCKIFVFGDNEHGQLWFDQWKNIDTPKIVDPDFSAHAEDCYKLNELFACNNQTAVLLTTNSKSPDFRNSDSHRSIATINKNLCDMIVEGKPDERVIEELRRVMSSQGCLSGCFSLPDQVTTIDNPGFNMTVAKGLFTRICQSMTLKESIAAWLIENLLPNLPINSSDIEALRVYIILPILLDFFSKPDYLEKLFFPFIEIILRLKKKQSRILNKWYKSIGNDFGVIVQLCCMSISAQVIKPNFKQVDMGNMLKYIEKLYKLNAKYNIVSYKKFYMPSSGVTYDYIQCSYDAWKSGTGQKPLFFSHPFLFDARGKHEILQVSAKFQSDVAFASNCESFINIEIDRKNLLSDTFCQLGRFQGSQTVLNVRFKGESQVYHAVLAKNFFMLVFEEVFNPKYGLFCEYTDSNFLWFAQGTESEKMYIVGLLCGLALYNDARINANFPLAMYKKLLLQEVNLEDFKEFEPVLGSSLQQLLDFEEEDGVTFEDVFVFTFTVSSSTRDVPLKDGGNDIAVTSANRAEFVRLYVNYVFNESVKQQYDSFSRGFLKVCSGELIDLFHPEELMEVMVGQQFTDWKEVEKRTTIPQDLTPEKTQVIAWFWEIFHFFSHKEKTNFLVFITSTNKVPITGLQMSIDFRYEDDTFLPVALTCHNLLQLHCYSSKEILEERLKLSIECKQFHKPLGY